ncbi:hypothetical protein OSL50_26375, partial [Escherichia coli]|nr:hypothetical protein [Escherichia coli]
NAELDGDKAIIEKFLYDSKVDRNKTTMESLLKNGQQRYGIVTSDGTIVDGNRRAMLLYKNNVAAFIRVINGIDRKKALQIYQQFIEGYNLT